MIYFRNGEAFLNVERADRIGVGHNNNEVYIKFYYGDDAILYNIEKDHYIGGRGIEKLAEKYADNLQRLLNTGASFTMKQLRNI